MFILKKQIQTMKKIEKLNSTWNHITQRQWLLIFWQISYQTYNYTVTNTSVLTKIGSNKICNLFHSLIYCGHYYISINIDLYYYCYYWLKNILFYGYFINALILHRWILNCFQFWAIVNNFVSYHCIIYSVVFIGSFLCARRYSKCWI